MPQAAGELTGGEAGDAAEGAGEMGAVTKTGGLARLLHAAAGGQKSAGLLHPAVDHIVDDGKAGGGFETVAQGGLAEVEPGCQLVQRQLFAQVGADIIF